MSECTCPHCGGAIVIGEAAKAPPETVMQLVLRPKAGQMLSAETVGGTLTALEKLLRATGKQLGAKTFTAVQGVTVNDGEVVFDLRIVNAPPGLGKAVGQIGK